ncbi:MAG: SpoIIE family protein phosphatase [Terracidiphilus sp.]
MASFPRRSSRRYECSLSRMTRSFLFSDGVTEAEDPDHELFEVAGLTKVLTGRDPESIEDLQTAILDGVRDFTRGEHQSDDLTLLVVRYRKAA